MHSLRYAGDPQKYKNSQELATSTDGKLSGVKVGGVCTTYGCGSNGSDIFLDTIAGPIYQTNVKKIFDQTNKDLFYYWPQSHNNTSYIRKGDFIRYGDFHISTVYSPKAECDDNGGNCTYEIIHAAGPAGGLYTYPEHDEERAGIVVFGRKVIITWENYGNPTGFGRIKLWD